MYPKYTKDKDTEHPGVNNEKLKLEQTNGYRMNCFGRNYHLESEAKILQFEVQKWEHRNSEIFL